MIPSLIATSMALKLVFRIGWIRPQPLWTSLMYCSYSNVCATHAYGASDSSAECEYAVQSLKCKLQAGRPSHVLHSARDLRMQLGIFRWGSYQRRCVHTAATYADMISKLTLVGNHDEMDELLKRMVKLDAPGLEQALDQLVHFFSKNSQFDEALLVIQHAGLAKCKPSVAACNESLHGFVKEGRGFWLFLLAYKEIVKAGTLPDVEMLNCLIGALCEANHLDLALNQFGRMRKKKCTPNSHTFEILIKALCSCGRVDESVKLFHQLLQLRCIPDGCFYVQVIPLFCEFNKPEEATKLYQMMKEGHQLDPHLYSVLIRCLCENQLLDDAIRIFKEMIASGHASLIGTYVDIIDCYCTVGEFHKAMSFLEENNVTEMEPYNVLLTALCKTGRLQDLVSYLEEFHNRGLVDCCSWNLVITQLCNEGNIRRASELIGRMIVSSFTPDKTTFSSIVSCYCRLGSYENVLHMFKRVRVSNLLLNSESFSQLIEGLCHMKKVQEAIEVFNYHIKRDCSLTGESLDMLIRGSCSDGKICEAIRIRSLAACAGSSCTFSTYNTIIHALLHLKKEKDILPLFAQMLVEGYQLEDYGYNVLLRCLCTGSSAFEAATLFNRMVNDGYVPSLETLELLIPHMASVSSLNTIAHSLSKVITVDGLMGPRICNSIIYGLIKEGFKSEACKFLDQMLEKGWVPDSKTHHVLVGSSGGVQTEEVCEVHQTDDDVVGNILVQGLN